jgi:hypothetical protein
VDWSATDETARVAGVTNDGVKDEVVTGNA